MRVTAERLAVAEPCGQGLRLFKRTFPDGATWPTDMERAAAAGLDVKWAAEKLGLLWPTDE